MQKIVGLEKYVVDAKSFTWRANFDVIVDKIANIFLNKNQNIFLFLVSNYIIKIVMPSDNPSPNIICNLLYYYLTGPLLLREISLSLRFFFHCLGMSIKDNCIFFFLKVTQT